MARSFAALYRNITSWFNYITPYFYKFMYYFSMPSIIVLGKFITKINCFRSDVKTKKPNSGSCNRLFFRK